MRARTVVADVVLYAVCIVPGLVIFAMLLGAFG